MFKWLVQRSEKNKQKTRKLRQRELSDLVVRDNAPQQVTADLLSSLLKTAIADAEEVVASIKMRAQAEAEAEATRIVAQVKLEAQEIQDGAEKAAQKQAEEIISVANRKAEIIVEEARQKALQYIASREKIEEPVQLREEAVEEKIEEPVQLREEAVEEKIEEPVQLQEEAVEEKIEEPTQLREEVTVSEAVEVITEERLPEERPGEGEPEPTPVKLDSHTPYTGEVDLVIPSPAELKLVSRLYNYLQTIPELRILYTRGTWDQGTAITVALHKPMPLIRLISETPGVEVTPSLLEKDALEKEKSSLPLRAGRKAVKRIKLILKEAQPR